MAPVGKQIHGMGQCSAQAWGLGMLNASGQSKQPPCAVLAQQDSGSHGIFGSGEWARRGSTLLQRDTSSSLASDCAFTFYVRKIVHLIN